MEIIKRLKQQQRLGGVPRLQNQEPLRNEVPVSTTNNLGVATVPLTEVQNLAEQLAAQIVAEQQAQSTIATNGRVYTKFESKSQGSYIKL